MTRWIALLALLPVLLGCTQGPPEQDRDNVLLRAILPPERLGTVMSLSQEVIAEYQEEKQAFRVEIDLTPTKMAMVGLTHMGVPMFSLVQQGGTVELEALGAGHLPFDPRHVLSDFQIAFWPSRTLQETFPSFGLTLETDPDGRHRRVSGREGEDLVDVEYLGAGPVPALVTIRHFDPPYRLQIRTTDVTER